MNSTACKRKVCAIAIAHYTMQQQQQQAAMEIEDEHSLDE